MHKKNVMGLVSIIRKSKDQRKDIKKRKKKKKKKRRKYDEKISEQVERFRQSNQF